MQNRLLVQLANLYSMHACLCFVGNLNCHNRLTAKSACMPSCISVIVTSNAVHYIFCMPFSQPDTNWTDKWFENGWVHVCHWRECTHNFEGDLLLKEQAFWSPTWPYKKRSKLDRMCTNRDTFDVTLQSGLEENLSLPYSPYRQQGARTVFDLVFHGRRCW